MFPLQTIIVDDEPDAGELLKNLLADFHSFEVQEVFTDANRALDAIVMEQPPVVFLDIEMPELSGMEMLKQIQQFSPDTKVVFITAYRNYALEALQNSAFDFICKPIDKTELQSVMRKLIAAIHQNEKPEKPVETKPLLLKTTEGHHYLIPDNILFLEADGNYTSIQLSDGKRLMSSINLGRIQEELLPSQFARISRKHIINKSHLSFINFCKKYCIVTQNGNEHKLEISVKMKDLKAELE